MEAHFTASTKLALAIVAAILAVEVYQAATLPIGTGEAYLYDRFVRPTTRLVLASELLDRDVLYSLLEKRSVGLFHVSPFAARLPGLVFGALYAWSVWRLARRFLGSGWRFLLAVIAGDVLAFLLGWFVQADGSGVALALMACAVWLAGERKYLNWIGVCLGLSVTAKMVFVIPAVMIALTILAIQRRWIEWTDQVLIPGLVVILIFLVLPLSHAHRIEEIAQDLTESQTIQVQSALEALRGKAGAEHIRIAAIPSVEPVVNFYRAQHRVNSWERATRDYSSEHFDYYLLSHAEDGLGIGTSSYCAVSGCRFRCWPVQERCCNVASGGGFQPLFDPNLRIS
jgi:hypothetical protein